MSGEANRGRIKDRFRAHMHRKFKLALTQEWASSRVPSPTVRPSDCHDQRFRSPELLLSHQPGRGVEEVPPPPHPGSVSQAKSPLDKLSSRASRKPVYILSYWHRSSHQPPRAGTPPSPLFLHHRAMSTMLQVRGWSPPPCNVVSSRTLIHRPAHVQQ